MVGGMKREISQVRLPTMAGDIFVPCPAGADLLSVGFRNGELHLAFMADVGAPMDRVRLLVLPEGVEVNLPDLMDLVLIGRAEKPAGSLVLASGKQPAPEVFHVFQIIRGATDEA